MKYGNKFIQIACDGGAATGKSTGALMIAKKYNLKFLSSGLLYRYASYLIIKHKPKKEVSFLRLEFKKLNLDNLKKLDLHTSKISEHSSIIAKKKKIREILKNFQFTLTKKNKKGCIEWIDISNKIRTKSN